MKRILSVGIDIGTSTTQVIFSSLSVENTSGYFTVPKISIVGKDIIYKGEIHRTPLRTRTLIDGEAVREIVAAEFKKAGYTPSQTETGAVIITGESARKENSEEVLRYLSDFAGEFVVSTAGPDIESIVAGKGSGAAAYSEDNGVAVVNLDIGGGTTNAVIFDDGEVSAKGCLDIGGRLITITDGKIDYISESARQVAEYVGVTLRQGDAARIEDLTRVCDGYAAVLEQFLGLSEPTKLLAALKTPGSSDFILHPKLRAVCFSGGVADFIYGTEADPFHFGDIGVLLGQAIRRSRVCSSFKMIGAAETIRATVVGAGTYTTSVSGSTIDYSDGLFPLKNIPVLRLDSKEQAACFSGDASVLREKFKWFLEQNDCRNAVVAMDGEKDPSYIAVQRLAKAIVDAVDPILLPSEPIMIVLRHDMAKVLGRQVRVLLSDKRPVISVDSIIVQQNDYIDMGRPLMEGMVIPVVVKTLIFG